MQPQIHPWGLSLPQNLILEAVSNRYNSLLAPYIHFAFLGSRGSRTLLGDPAGLAAWLGWLPGWPGCLAGLAAWLAGLAAGWPGGPRVPKLNF